MNKQMIYFLQLIIVLFLYQTGVAQETDKEQKHSLLWEISGKNLEQKSYLFGTIHVIPKDDFFFTQTMSDKFNECNALALEVNMSEVTMKDQFSLAKKMFLPENETLENYMDEEDYQWFYRYCIDSLEIKERKMEKYVQIKPLFLSVILLSHKLGKTVVYEDYLNKKATKQDMELYGLETLEFQMAIIDSLAIEEQVELFLGEKGEQDFNMIDEFDELLNAYKSQNIEKLYELMKSDDAFDPYEDHFLIKRNQKWIPIIEELIKEQSVFIAVGAGHLSGEHGVIKLLRRNGYTVKPVTGEE